MLTIFYKKFAYVFETYKEINCVANLSAKYFDNFYTH